MRMVALVNFQDELKKRTEEINKVIQSYLPAEEGFAKTMAQAMNYSILAGGKRRYLVYAYHRYLAECMDGACGADPYHPCEVYS